MAEEQVKERPVVLCRHCDAQLFLTGNGVWTDVDGMPACIKAMYGRPAVLHTPLPTGMRGAPE